jgi:hypothetical protein
MSNINLAPMTPNGGNWGPGGYGDGTNILTCFRSRSIVSKSELEAVLLASVNMCRAYVTIGKSLPWTHGW